MTNWDEKAVIKRCTEGDEKAFEELFDQYERKLYNFCYRMMGNFEEAKDVTQEVLIKIVRNIKSFRADSAFSTWAFQIAKNAVYDHGKKKSNQNVLINDEEGNFFGNIKDEQIDIEKQAEVKDKHEILSKAIKKLPEDYKEVIVLKEIQEFPLEEVAKILKIPTGTVKSRLFRAREQLREILIKDFNFFKLYHMEVT